MTTAEMPNVCEGCPAAHALVKYRDNLLASDEQTTRASMRLADAESAVPALDAAAGTIACKDLVKSLPPLRDHVGDLGKLRLYRYVSKCPAFKPSLKIRLQQRAVSEEVVQHLETELES